MPRLALIQMRVDPGQPEANLARARDRLQEAAAQGADLAVLPEVLDCGWTHPSVRDNAGPIPGGPSFEFLADLASKNRIWLVAGLTERFEERIYNAAVLLAPDGSLRLHHRKINELEIARDLYATGDRLGVAETEFGTVGLMICADAFAPGQVISRTLGMMGARLIVSPCAWAVPADHDQAKEPYGALWRENYGPVARDFQLWIAGVSNVGPITEGPWKGRRCIGCSMLVGPDGGVREQGPYGEAAEAVILTEVEL